MRIKVLTVLFALMVFPFFAFSGETKTEKEKIIEQEYKLIRNDILKNAFSAFNYHNEIIIKEFSEIYYGTAYKHLKADSLADKKLISCIGQIPNLDGNNPEKCFKDIKKYLNQVSDGCKKNNKEIKWVPKIENRINALNEEYKIWCDCEGKNDFSNYKSKYKKGHFVNLIPENNTASALTTVAGNAPNNSQQTTNANSSKDTVNGGNDNKHNSSIGILILIVLALIVGGYLFYRNKKSAMKITDDANNSDLSSKHEPMIETTKETTTKEENNDNQANLPKPQPTKESNEKISEGDSHLESSSSTKKWILVGASVIGNGHIQSNMPCQDNHKFEHLGDGWGIAIVSDGAGSAAHSELGSKVVAERGVFHFKKLIEKEGWMKDNVLPTDIEWLQKSYYTLKAIRDDVALVSKKNNIELKSLSATCLAVIYSPIGLLTVHVGDGRMGYKSESGEWHAIITPHKGEEANQTIFLVSDFWSTPNYIMSNVLVPESIIVREPVKAFTLMSDGCENTAWKCTTLNPDTGKYYDQNKPFEGFFNPLEETLLSFHTENVPENERLEKWKRFIESGTSGFVKEQDDKTMIYGIIVNK